MDPIGLLIMACGILCVAAAICDWEWFMNHRKARFLSSIITRTGARVFYVLIGVFVSVAGLGIASGFINRKG